MASTKGKSNPNNPPLPHRIVLPFGYRITVKRLTSSDPKLLDEETGEVLEGWSDLRQRLICIRKGLKPRRARFILLHELEHILADCTLDAINRGIAEG